LVRKFAIRHKKLIARHCHGSMQIPPETMRAQLSATPTLFKFAEASAVKRRRPARNESPNPPGLYLRRKQRREQT
jgi:hypothetical protein